MKHQIEKTTFTTKMIAWNKKQRLISNKQLKKPTNMKTKQETNKWNNKQRKQQLCRLD
jgi:hypothetical protein